MYYIVIESNPIDKFRYICPKCNESGIPSIYVDECTACANERRFGLPRPRIIIENVRDKDG